MDSERPVTISIGRLFWRGLRLLAALLSFTALLSGAGLAENGAEAWLRYAPLSRRAAKQYQHSPSEILLLRDSLVLKAAQQELARGLGQMLGKTMSPASNPANAFILGTLEDLRPLAPRLRPPQELKGDAFWLKQARIRGARVLVVTASSDRGVLYGVFRLLSKIARGESIAFLDEFQQPYAPIRWVNQWDNLDGRIERGYGGASIFFANGGVRADLTRAAQYARLLASLGINGCTVNNVNAAPEVLAHDFIPQLARIADVFRPWGVQLSISVDLSSPAKLTTIYVGAAPQAVTAARSAAETLDTFDPLDPRVAAWWRAKADEIYRQIPDFAGFVVKADSEGRSGPSAYGRSHADAANVIARALKPHRGIVFYRAFVYNHHLDWRNSRNDRANAAYDNFHPLDGQFDDNAIVQIKNGPIDFQVREPVSPLFAGLRRTNQAIELQITQEYTGQQKHLCFLVPMWKEVLEFDLRIDNHSTPTKEVVSGRTFRRPLGGFAGVANVGMDANWLGSPLAMANLYGFGRLAWNPNLTSEQIIGEWTRLTFGSDPLVLQTVNSLQLNSWRVYESYTGPLGAGTLTNITGNHYDPRPESSENNGWGQWHRADHEGIGMDRTIATGTGFIGQYPREVENLYESLAGCPDRLLLFFHHVPYTYVLHSGKTVIQHIYDSHYEGADQARGYIAQWKKLEGHIDQERYRGILAGFEFQAAEAVKWRDSICGWIYRVSGIPDQKGRLRVPPKTLPEIDLRMRSSLSAMLKTGAACTFLRVPLTFTLPGAFDSGSSAGQPASLGAGHQNGQAPHHAPRHRKIAGNFNRNRSSRPARQSGRKSRDQGSSPAGRQKSRLPP
ncbi:MAG TPA: alpha-glucuronidase family glycosyl hydrolase [Candidatus Sulfotelmatobacter sp.]|nr:alpha-glucuronidase family glycosyl hydrolase [Candidatus Sulfotelmatobacter sp.]